MRILCLAPLLLAACGPTERSATNQDAAVPAPGAPDATLPTSAPVPDAPAPGETAAPPANTAVGASVFTSLDPARCRLVEENRDEGGYSRHDCPGHAGYRLELIESDLRQTVAIVRPGGVKEQLNLGAIGGGGFSTIGKTVEWRGTDPAKPRTLTLRYAVNENPDPKVPPRSYLVVARLAVPACPVAIIAPGPNQSTQARAVADQRTLPGCTRR